MTWSKLTKTAQKLLKYVKKVRPKLWNHMQIVWKIQKKYKSLGGSDFSFEARGPNQNTPSGIGLIYVVLKLGELRCSHL